jgi:CBS domain-containing protein
MKVSQVMTPQVKMVAPNQSIQEAAQIMAKIDAGILPVGEKDRLIGMITDRDIAVRAVARGLTPDAKVRDVMSPEVLYCFEDEDIVHVAHNMGDVKVRRLPVVSRAKELVGIVSLSDVAMAEGPDIAGGAICGISEPGGRHSQHDGGAPR